jgi:hypothetical protein
MLHGLQFDCRIYHFYQFNWFENLAVAIPFRFLPVTKVMQRTQRCFEPGRKASMSEAQIPQRTLDRRQLYRRCAVTAGNDDGRVRVE